MATKKIVKTQDSSKMFKDEIDVVTKKIVEQAKLLSTGKVRSTYEIEKAARHLTQIELKINKK